MKKKPVKVFISYAIEDYETAKRLYNDLKLAGIEPWIGKEDIQAGQNWEYGIRKTIRESSYFLALLSSKSVSKIGYVQTVVKIALDILDKHPKSEIFLLPVRLDDCKPHDEKLQELQQCDLFPSYEQGLKEILRVISPPILDCPPTLGELIQKDQDCAHIIQRDELVYEIKRYLIETPDPKHVVIYGEPLSGKTHILSRLSEVIGNEYIPLLVSTQFSPLTSLNYFLFFLISQLTNKFNVWAKYKEFPVTFDDPDLSEFEDGKEKTAFYKHWKYLRQIAGEKQPIVMFDEIDQLLDQPDKLDERILTFLDSFIGDPACGYFVLAGSERIQYSKNRAFSLLIKKGQFVRVSYFKEETVLSVFSAVQCYFSFEGDTLKRILTLCDGHPRFLQHVYEEIVSIITKFPGKQKLEESDIELLVNNVIERTKELLWQMLQRLSDRERFVIKLVSQKTFDPVNGPECYLKELFELAKRYPDSAMDNDSLRKGVFDLADREWIEWKKNELFRFKLGILLLWLRYHYINLDEI